MTALLAARIMGILCLLGWEDGLPFRWSGASHGDPLRLLPEMVSSKQAELNQLKETGNICLCGTKF